VRVAAAISAVTFNIVRFTTPTSMAKTFIPDWTVIASLLSRKSMNLDLSSGMRVLLQLDQLSSFAAAFLWLAYLLHDLKKAKMTQTGWASFVGLVALGVVAVGPGATLIAGWMAREEILACKHLDGTVVRENDKDALTREKA